MNIKPPFFDFRSPGRLRRTLGGFSLVEITLALGIVTFALVGIVGVLPLAMTSSRQSFDKNRAAAIAATLFTSFRSQPFQSVGYLDGQFDPNGQPVSSPTVAPLDLNAVSTSTAEVTFYGTFLDNNTVVTTTTDPYGASRRLYFGSAMTGGADYLIRMHFNNQPAGSVITPVPSASPNGQPTVPAPANQVELIIASVSRPLAQYRFMSIGANRTN